MFIVNALWRSAQIRPTHLSTVFKGRSRTYQETLDRVARLAASFEKLGLADDARIGILSLNSDRFFEYTYAVPWSGRIMVPLNTRLAVAELLYMCDHAEVQALFFDDAFVDQYPEFRAKANTIAHYIYMGEGPVPENAHGFEDLIAQNESLECRPRDMDALLGIYYTGGTTGLPKGVMVSHGNMAHNVMCFVKEYGFTPDSRLLHLTPMFHLADVLTNYTLTSMAGTHYFMPVFSIDGLIETLHAQKITNINLVAVMVGMLADHPKRDSFDLSNLGTIAYGTAPIPEPILKKALTAFPDIRFTQIYGQTEVCGALSFLAPEYHVFEGVLAGKLRSAGRPTYGFITRIVDPNGVEVPLGQTGELVCRSPSNMIGYLKNPEQTSNTLRNGWLYTGDIGYMDKDGFIFLVDRAKDMIVSGGENIYSSEVEHAVAAFPGVAEVAVIGIPSAQWGEEVHAIVVPVSGVALVGEEIIAHCRTLIGRFKCPKSVTVRQAPLPLSGTGKIQKNVLREHYWAGVPRKIN